MNIILHGPNLLDGIFLEIRTLPFDVFCLFFPLNEMKMGHEIAYLFTRLTSCDMLLAYLIKVDNSNLHEIQIV